jgi:RNA recognition motif-containing protein
MGGVGAFTRDNKSLYIQGLKRNPNLEQVVKRHFGEWGELDSVRVIFDKNIAFVKYKLRAAAEFAKEAMQDQGLEGDEIIQIKWANEDPNVDPVGTARPPPLPNH